MQQLKIAQYYNNCSPISRTNKEILEKVNVDYCIPDKLPNKQDLKDWSGYTSLHFTAKRMDVDLTIQLVKQGADLVKQGTQDGCTPLLAAIGSTAFTGRSIRALYEISGHLQENKTINALLSKQVEIGNTLNPKCNKGVSHLHVACIVNHTDAINFFMKAKEPINQHTNSDIRWLAGYTPLHCAVKYSSVQAADILLQHGADLFVKNTEGMSCVHLLVDRIINASDFITMGNHGVSTPCLEEVKRIESIIKLVLRKTRASVEIFVDNTGFSALHLACTLRDKSIAGDLIKQDVDVNMPVKSESKFWPGWTPLHFAASCNVETMVLLMQHGADILRRDSKGETPLDLCAKRFTPADVQLVLSKQGELKDITLSDNCTKLSDLLLAMNDYEKFSTFLQNLKDVNLTVPVDSPIWPGYNMLHLCVSLNEKTISWEQFYQNSDLSETTEEGLVRYNCTEEEETLYLKRIEVCLEHGCSLSAKNAKEQSPIHLAFGAFKESTVGKLLSWSDENVVDQGGLSHLHIACAAGTLDEIKKYLSEGADVNSRVKIGFTWYHKRYGNNVTINVRANSTPLHVAVLFAHASVIEYLLEREADVYAKDSLDFTPIHTAIFALTDFRSRCVVELIYRMNPRLRDCMSKVGLSHLHVAAYVDNYEVVEQLLSEGAEVDSVVDAKVKDPPVLARFAGKTPLHVALSEDADGAVKALLRGGANVYAKDLKGITALTYSMHQLGEASTKYFIRMLKRGKCDVESSGTTPLHAACQSYDIRWAKKLLKKGADVNATIQTEGNLKGATPLYVLVDDANAFFEINARVFIDFVKLLMNNGADATIECCGQTPLHKIYENVFADFFLEAEDEEVIEDMRFMLHAAGLLLKSQKSYDVNPTNSQGLSHFHLACVINDVESVKKFLDHGVDVNESTDPLASEEIDGFTPLHFALAHHSKEVAHVLLERGADVNAEDSNGNKPLHASIKRKFVDLPLMEAMISHGADIHAENLHGETLLTCLLNSGGLTLEGLEFFLNYDCSIKIADSEITFHEGIIGLAMRNAAPDELLPILKRLMQIFEVKSAMQNGFNVIQNIVTVDENGDLTVDDYLKAIEFLMGVGCDIDQQNTKGRTALHEAVLFLNVEAIDALLQLGVDVNVVDGKGIGAFPNNIVSASQIRETHDIDVIKVLMHHLWKMRFSGLDINDLNLRSFEIAEKLISLDNLEQSCQDEWAKAKETEIYQGLTVRDFLSEVGVVAEYPRIYPIRRNIIDKFFKRTVELRRDFPQFCGLLASQYKKTLIRMELWEPAKDAIVIICQIELPDLCLEAILRYFTNSEMKVAIELAPQLLMEEK